MEKWSVMANMKQPIVHHLKETLINNRQIDACIRARVCDFCLHFFRKNSFAHSNETWKWQIAVHAPISAGFYCLYFIWQIWVARTNWKENSRTRSLNQRQKKSKRNFTAFKMLIDDILRIRSCWFNIKYLALLFSYFEVLLSLISLIAQATTNFSFPIVIIGLFHFSN